MKNLISYRGGAEDAEKKRFLIHRLSDLRELRVSAVNIDPERH
jgi:hypothetical protein